MSEQLNMRLNDLSIKLGILQTEVHNGKVAMEKLAERIKELEELRVKEQENDAK